MGQPCSRPSWIALAMTSAWSRAAGDAVTAPSTASNRFRRILPDPSARQRDEQGARPDECAPYSCARIIEVTSESMEPTLPDKASIVVNTGQRDPRHGRIFVVPSDCQHIVQRLIRDRGAGWMLQGDNPNKWAWPTRPWPDGTQIVGEVRWDETNVHVDQSERGRESSSLGRARQIT